MYGGSGSSPAHSTNGEETDRSSSPRRGPIPLLVGTFPQRGMKQGTAKRNSSSKQSLLIILSNAKPALFIIQQKNNT